MMLQKGQIIKGTCKDLSFEGKGMVEYEKEIIYVKGLFIGECADIEILYKRAGVYFGKIRKLYRFSKDRIEPKCKICTSCGGCQFQQLNYQAQLAFKKRKVEKAFYRVFRNNDIKVDDVVGMDNNPYFYRNKIQVPFKKDRKGRNVYGFYKENSHDIIPFDKCYIQDERTHEVLKTILKLMNEFKLEAFNEDTGYGLIRHVLLKTSSINDDIMVVFVASTKNFPSQRNFIKELVKRCPNIKSIVINENKRHTNVILGENEKVLYGPGFITDEILGVKFHVSSKSFFQVNHDQCVKLYDLAIKNLELTKDDTLLDAYAGVGTMGLISAKHVKEVLSVEINHAASEDGKKNAIANQIDNIKFINADSTEFILKNRTKFDAIIIDPPRKGCDARFLKALLDSGCKKISYVSCNPDSLVEDLKILAEKYNIVKVTPVDMFPFTYHVESVVSLRRK